MYKKNQQKQKIAGFTIIELMVSMVLSMFLIGGVITIYISSKQTSHARNELSSVGDNARSAIHKLTQHIEHTGYATPNHIEFGQYVVATGSAIAPGLCGDGSDNITDEGILTDSSDGVNADSITVVTLADTTLNRDCTGQPIKSACQVGQAANIDGAKIYNSFYVQTPAGETEPALFCSGSVGAAPIRLADGVEDMQLKYGVDTSGNLVADKYLTASEVDSGALWESIVSVQVALLVRSLQDIKLSRDMNRYQLLDKTVVTNDRKQRSVFTTEIRLRNVLL